MAYSFSNSICNVAKVCRGLFLTDPNRSPWGRVWQLFSRFTWELPQTLVGWLFTTFRALFGQVDRVDALGGITFAIKTRGDNYMGVSIGSFVELWDAYMLLEGDKGPVLSSQLYMHEFGHTADSQRFGWLYLPVIGLASLVSAMGKGDHSSFWTEIRANRHAKRYFGKKYHIDWSEIGYPTKVIKSRRSQD